MLSHCAQSCPTLCGPMDCAYQAPLSVRWSVNRENSLENTESVSCCTSKIIMNPIVNLFFFLIFFSFLVCNSIFGATILPYLGAFTESGLSASSKVLGI